ncbi:hypothetical protein B0A55_02278 [Friedmanniomyces simplex]|uniref:Uncharacterized protein n=1 Tax=Friedmanniomyces simplex TaxID=329884 RepID=A0A4U0XXL9_9PEZI|nr:hypothetical protein B0A55_02278 [Friedmanniomyces simplex]
MVKIFLAVAGQPDQLLDSLPEDRIRTHSASIDRALAAQVNYSAAEKTVHLSGAAPAALKYVIHRIAGKKETQSLHIKVHDMPLDRAVAVFEATEVLGIRPEEMWVVTIASLHRRQTSKIFRTLVHQVAWNLVHQRYSEDEAQALQDRAKEWPDLHFTVDKKVTELKGKKPVHDTRTPVYLETPSPTDE